MRVEIVIPFFNEAHRLDACVSMMAGELAASPLPKQGHSLRFWWADDGSTDGSSEKLHAVTSRLFDSRVEHHILRTETNHGKGSAMRHAIDLLKDKIPADSIVAFWDSDGELHPKALFDGILMLIERKADVVFGSRFGRPGAPVLSRFHYLGNKALTHFSNAFSGLSLTDVHCCARIVRADVLFQLPLTSEGFDFEAEFAALVGRVKEQGLKIMEIDVPYMPRTVHEGKKIGLRHVLPQLYQAVRCRFFAKPVQLQGGRFKNADD